jgi:hypothetical protein
MCRDCQSSSCPSLVSLWTIDRGRDTALAANPIPYQITIISLTPDYRTKKQITGRKVRTSSSCHDQIPGFQHPVDGPIRFSPASEWNSFCTVVKGRFTSPYMAPLWHPGSTTVVACRSCRITMSIFGQKVEMNNRIPVFICSESSRKPR